VSAGQCAEVNLSNFKGCHGSAKGEFLSNEVLDLFHVLGYLALCLAALGPVGSCKAMLVFGLSFC
jgi:hypothetical protein